MTPPLEAPLFFASAKSVNGLCSRLTQSCTQRTGKPYARLLTLSGYTKELLKCKFDPYTLDAE